MNKYQLFLRKFPQTKRSHPLAPLTTYKIGGPADLFLEVADEKIIVSAIREAKKLKIKWFLLGGGSNLVISDEGFRGLVLKIKEKPIVVKNSQITAGAGCNLQKVVKRAQKESLTGLEFAVGIPGTLGGAVYGNAGAWGRSMEKVLASARVLSPDGKVEIWKNKDFGFTYRASKIKGEKGQKHIILAVTLKLHHGKKKKIAQEMAKNLIGRGHLPKEFSAGCIFQNVIATPQITKKFPPQAIKHGKIPTGWIVERLGLKGKKSGKAFISRAHGNFILNPGGASASDIKKLKNLIKEKTRERFGLKLKEEVEFVG